MAATAEAEEVATVEEEEVRTNPTEVSTRRNHPIVSLPLPPPPRIAPPPPTPPTLANEADSLTLGYGGGGGGYGGGGYGGGGGGYGGDRSEWSRLCLTRPSSH